MDGQGSLKAILYVLNISVFLLVIMGFFWVMKWKYNKDISPSKKHPHGCLIAEFWTEAGPRRREVVPIAANGFEVNPPSGVKLPRYFYRKSSIGYIGYPSWMPFKFLQIQAPTVSWQENCSDAIDPKKTQCSKWQEAYAEFCDGIIPQNESIMTAEMHDQIRDTDALGVAQAIDEEMKAQQKELQKALTTRLDKRVVYILLAVNCAVAVAAAAFAYYAMTSVRAITAVAGA